MTYRKLKRPIWPSRKLTLVLAILQRHPTAELDEARRSLACSRVGAGLALPSANGVVDAGFNGFE